MRAPEKRSLQALTNLGLLKTMRAAALRIPLGDASINFDA
jgi:hypothetical protein